MSNLKTSNRLQNSKKGRRVAAEKEFKQNQK